LLLIRLTATAAKKIGGLETDFVGLGIRFRIQVVFVTDGPRNHRLCASSVWAWLGVHVVTAACLLACICGCRTTSRVTEQNSASNPAPDAKIQGIAFEEIAIASGLNFSWPRGPRPLRVDEAFGAGCAFLDWNNDGWQDILLLGKPVAALFQNDGKNRFEDVTAASRLSNIAGDWKGCAVGDYDGDGWLDVLLNGNHSRVLLHNEGGRAWRDVTRNAGLEQRGPNRWGSSAGFMDLDANGTLDLVICHYVIFGPKEKRLPAANLPARIHRVMEKPGQRALSKCHPIVRPAKDERQGFGGGFC
jgi:hypothetical protein